MVKPGDIRIKDTEVTRGLMERNFSPLLIQIIIEVAKKYGIVITESYREQRHSGDLHSTNPVRAIDIREWCYPEWQAKVILNFINQTWEYDPKRPEMKVAILHKVKNGAWHFHVQVHPGTRRK